MTLCQYFHMNLLWNKFYKLPALKKMKKEKEKRSIPFIPINSPQTKKISQLLQQITSTNSNSISGFRQESKFSWKQRQKKAEKERKKGRKKGRKKEK